MDPSWKGGNPFVVMTQPLSAGIFNANSPVEWAGRRWEKKGHGNVGVSPSPYRRSSRPPPPVWHWRSSSLSVWECGGDFPICDNRVAPSLFFEYLALWWWQRGKSTPFWFFKSWRNHRDPLVHMPSVRITHGTIESISLFSRVLYYMLTLPFVLGKEHSTIGRG